MMAAPLRIALFGGSFDPPHCGHVAIARAAADAFALDQVYVAPAGRQPLKQGGHAARYEQRLAMVRLTCAADARLVWSDIDAPRPDGLPNYTIDTLERLAAEHPGATLYNLAGADSFQHLAAWHQAERLVDAAEWIVVSRPGVPLELPPGLPLEERQRQRIHLFDAVHADVAATGLRERLAAGDPCSDLLPAAVARYIAEHHLYGAHA